MQSRLADKTERATCRWGSTPGLLALLGIALGALLFPTTALADDEVLAAKRATWQSRYRTLLRNKAILEDNIAKLEHNYAQAQRRNYPRGGAREAFRTKANAQRQQLADVEARLERIFSEAREADVPPGWLYEVEETPIDLEANPPAAAEPDAAEEEPADDGRNPLYRD